MSRGPDEAGAAPAPSRAGPTDESSAGRSAALPRSTSARLAERGIEPRSYPHQGRWVETPAGALHVVDEGSGPCVVLLHGNPTWGFYYRRLIRRLALDHRVVVPDHLGCGLSDRPTRAEYGFTLRERVDDLDAVLNALGVERASFVLHDWGGMIGLSWIVDHLERCARVVVLNTAGFGLPPGARIPWSLRLARTPLLGALLVRGLGLFEKGAARWCTTRGFDAATRHAYLAPYASWADRLAVHEFVRDIPLAPSHRSWSRVQQTAAALDRLAEEDLLVGWGQRDFVFDDAFLAMWRERFPGARYEVFPEAGHYVLEDAGEGLEQVIAEHVGAVDDREDESRGSR